VTTSGQWLLRATAKIWIAFVNSGSAAAVRSNLPGNHRDQALSGDWMGYRECHIKPDLLPIYRKPDADTLRLARLGSHSELFG